MSRKTIKRKSDSDPAVPAPSPVDGPSDNDCIIPEVIGPDGSIEPSAFEMELVEKNRQEVIPAMSGDARTLMKAKQEESKDQRRAFQIWYRQHLSGLFKADQVDAAVAKVMNVEIGTLRRWKIMFGWAKRLENLKKEEKAEERVLLFAKNEAIEHKSLDVLLAYLNHVKSLAPADILPHHVSMMMKLVDFSQKNKDKMDPPDQTMQAGGVSLTIHQD